MHHNEVVVHKLQVYHLQIVVHQVYHLMHHLLCSAGRRPANENEGQVVVQVVDHHNKHFFFFSFSASQLVSQQVYHLLQYTTSEAYGVMLHLTGVPPVAYCGAEKLFFFATAAMQQNKIKVWMLQVVLLVVLCLLCTATFGCK